MGDPSQVTEEADEGTTDPDPQFVHLHTHTHYSLLACPIRPKALVKAAVADGQQALALTDNGNLFGAIEFYKACKSEGIKPILGMTAFYASASSYEKSGAQNTTYQLTLLAYSQEGFENLKRLTTHGYVHGFYYRPRIDKEVLTQHSKGILALSGGSNGPIERMLLANDMVGAKAMALSLQEILGEGNFYLELMSLGSEAQDKTNQGLLEIHRETGIPVVATNDVHYLAQEDWIAQEVMLCIREGKAIKDPTRFQMSSRELFFKSRADMNATFQAIDGAIENTLAIAERCNVEIQFNVYHLPVFDSGPDENPDEAIERIVHEGAKKRYGTITSAILDRINYELSVIKSLGFPSYFLITADFIQHARDQGIPVGPGRGSAAGSIVAYCMWITDLDPLKYNLIFERFLNAERLSMPDIDVDFCGNRRDEVIDYCRNKYNSDNVSQIITFGTMASRGVLRDVGRVLEIPLGDIDKIAKKVPQGPGASLKAALEEDKELQAIRDESTSNKRLFELGLKLEGLARHSSVHAAGVVIADRPVGDYVPLAKSGDDIITQWQMTELEEVGLLKVDFLGLKTLTILTEAVRLIQKVHGTEIDLAKIPLDDAKTFELMTTGDTLGVFQLESSGMRELLAKLKPDTFEDVVAVLALYRPGPLGSGMVDMFVDRKHGREKVEYPHESLQTILEETYGVIVYQEQVMRTANIFAGFSMNEADALRKAMGKKKPEVMAKFKASFISGASELGHEEKFSTELFETIEYFAGYGFNKSHSAAYALLTFQTAYLKTHYPVETYAANLTIEAGNSDKVKEFVDEIHSKELQLHPPSVNSCHGYFNASSGEIFYGLHGIKGVGERIASAIGEEREKNGDYKSMVDFCERHDPSILNKTALDALCKTGAFDCMGSTRKGAFDSTELVLRSSAQAREDRRRGQGSLFAMPDDRHIDNDATQQIADDEWSESELLAHEKTALGFYLSGHPFKNIGTFLTSIAGHDSESFCADTSGQPIRVAGMISGLRILQIRSGRNAGKKMARFMLEDLKGALPVTCFARCYESVGPILADDEIVFARGRLDARSEEPAMLLDEVIPFRRTLRSEIDGIVVRMEAESVTDTLLNTIATTAAKHRGNQKLLVEVSQDDNTFVIRCDAEHSIDVCPEFLDDLSDATGSSCLSFTRR
jgi:DNA polymerase-3 subunit alpha